MPAKKEDPMKATHYATAHVTGPFAKGAIVTAEELNDSFGRNDKHTDEQHEKYLAASLKRLLDLGAIVPTEAPEEPAEAAAPAEHKSTERQVAEEEAAARKAKAETPPKK